MRSFPSIVKEALAPRYLAQWTIVAVPLVIGFMIARRAVDIPFWDEWEWADLIYKMHTGALQLSDVWAQHSEHRMLVPNVIVLSLARFGGWHPEREQFFSLVLLVLSQLMIVGMFRRSSKSSLGVFGALAASLMLYGVWQWENLSWGFQIAWFFCNICAIAVAMLLARPDRHASHVALAVIVAALGSYSSSQGLVIWVVGVAALLLCGKRGVAALGVWIPAACIVVFVYRHGMFPVDTGHINVVTHPLVALRYIFAYLGSPVARWLGAGGSMIAGACCTISIVVFFISDLRSPYRTLRLARAGCWYALSVYPMVCAIGTSTGRAGFGIDQALASRYTTIGGLLWIALIGLAVTRHGPVRAGIRSRQSERLGFAAMAFGFLIGANSLMGSNEWKSTEAVLVGARAQLGASDPAALPKLYPDSGREIMLIGRLREVHDGPFALSAK